MSMTETPPAPRPTPTKPKRKYKRQAKPREASAQPKPKDEFAGMTATECPTACSAERCVITERIFCGHPMKGGVQAPLLRHQDVVDRLERARKALKLGKLR